MNCSSSTRVSVAAQIEREGYAVIRGVFDKNNLDQLRSEVDTAVLSGHLSPVSRQGSTAASEDELRQLSKQGLEYLARSQPMVYVRDPLIVCASAVPIVFAELILDLADEYYGTPASILSPKLVKSFVNDLPESASSVHHFHIDYRETKYLKVFVYLNDVDERGGPLCFVAGSHVAKPSGWREHAFEWSQDEMQATYGADAIKTLTGVRGDLIVADTRGFHRALKARSQHRTQLRAGTGLEPAPGPKPRIGAQSFESLNGRQRAAADFFEVI